jgi:SM-20-related protein
MLTGSNVQILDGLLEPPLQEALINVVAWLPLYFINRQERFQSDALDMHWHYPITLSDNPDEIDVEGDLRALDEGLQPIAKCWDRIKAACAYPVRLYECELSANTFGTEGRVHHDIRNPALRSRHRTALVYCCKSWDANWAGDTLVFDELGEISAAVIPRPGRVMLISGDPKHVGRSTSRICPSDRRVLSFKFWALD